ncbi:expressed protein [Dictyostelium purpureum]|uniref:Expressed protein n=1 Tax=Dictyostelium purpureum TaxID=5786 RepID=F0ZD58_DICPU|nr:uncharacterized protein DICPUDRAFT_93900 [Dictyostelium purpureum]EGC38147.1 expressed protein [Dictyostelium purpureum]|eukprot:XP_003285361.1 expressed protein [Dictyostelium purpureum]
MLLGKYSSVLLRNTKRQKDGIFNKEELKSLLRDSINRSNLEIGDLLCSFTTLTSKEFLSCAEKDSISFNHFKDKFLK